MDEYIKNIINQFYHLEIKLVSLKNNIHNYDDLMKFRNKILKLNDEIYNLSYNISSLYHQ